jgi:hypothetical protein
MGFGDMNKGNNFRGGAPASVDLLVQFSGANLVDPKKASDKDAFTVTHVRGGLGKQAGETDEIVLGKFEKKPGGKERPSLWEHANGRVRGVEAAKAGAFFMIQGAKRGADGKIEARWVKNLGMPDPEMKNVVLSITAKVIAPSADRDGNYHPKRGPKVRLMDVTRATRVGGHTLKDGEVSLSHDEIVSQEKIESLGVTPRAAQIDDAIKAAMAQQFAGDPGLMLRIVPDDGRAFCVNFIRPVEKKGDEWVAKTPEECLELFKERHGDLYNAVLTETDGFAEIIPFVVVGSGGATTERALKEITEAKEKDPKSYPKDRNSEKFYGPVEIVRNDQTVTQNQSCYMDTVTVIQSKEPSTGYFYWTDVYPMDRRKFADPEVVTYNLSDALVNKFTAAAVERGKRQHDAKNDAAPEKAEGENFGEDPQVEGAASPAPGR